MARTPAIDLSKADYRTAARRSKAYRDAHQLTQMQLAVQLGARLADISTIENCRGKRSSRVVKAILDLELPATPAVAD